MGTCINGLLHGFSQLSSYMRFGCSCVIIFHVWMCTAAVGSTYWALPRCALLSGSNEVDAAMGAVWLLGTHMFSYDLYYYVTM